MNEWRRTISALLWAAAAATMAVGCLGCVPAIGEKLLAAIESPDRSLERAVTVPDGTPQELIAAMEGASQESVRLADEAANGAQGTTCTDENKRQIFTGLKAADKLIAHSDANHRQIEKARQTKLTLLYLGARDARETFKRRFDDFVQGLQEEDARSETTALARACSLELDCISGDAPKKNVLPMLVNYAETFPDSGAGVELFRAYGRRLESESDRVAAIECYRSATSLYGRRPHVEPMWQQLAALEFAEAEASPDGTERKRAHDIKMGRIARKLGNHKSGFFVIYAEQNVKPPRSGGIYFYRYEYDVLMGPLAVAAYEDDLPANWSWKMVRRFPPSSEGRDQAYDLWKERLKKKGKERR